MYEVFAYQAINAIECQNRLLEAYTALSLLDRNTNFKALLSLAERASSYKGRLASCGRLAKGSSIVLEHSFE